MMVRSPDIDHAIKPTAILIVMIGDVRSEVGQRAIGLAQDAILVVTKIRRTEPQGSVLFKGKASLLQALKGFFNSSALHKRTLGEPHLMLNPEFPQVFLDAVEDGLHTVGKTPVLPFRIGKGGQPWIFVHHLARNINDIGPSIVIFRPFHSYSGKFLGTQVPAVGFSIGFERVCGILLEQGYQIPGAKQKIALLYGKDADFPAVLSKAAALRDTYNVTVLQQAKKLGKQLGQLEAAGFAGAAFMDKDEVKIFAQQ